MTDYVPDIIDRIISGEEPECEHEMAVQAESQCCAECGARRDKAGGVIWTSWRLPALARHIYAAARARRESQR